MLEAELSRSIAEQVDLSSLLSQRLNGPGVDVEAFTALSTNVVAYQVGQRAVDATTERPDRTPQFGRLRRAAGRAAVVALAALGGGAFVSQAAAASEAPVTASAEPWNEDMMKTEQNCGGPNLYQAKVTNNSGKWLGIGWELVGTGRSGSFTMAPGDVTYNPSIQYPEPTGSNPDPRGKTVVIDVKSSANPDFTPSTFDDTDSFVFTDCNTGGTSTTKKPVVTSTTRTTSVATATTRPIKTVASTPKPTIVSTSTTRASQPSETTITTQPTPEVAAAAPTSTTAVESLNVAAAESEEVPDIEETTKTANQSTRRGVLILGGVLLGTAGAAVGIRRRKQTGQSQDLGTS